MGKLPNVTIYAKKGSTLYYRSKDDKGDLCNAYLPLQNLENEETNLLTDFTTEKLNFDLKHPVEIIPQDAYDGAVNLVLNDGKNPIRLVNSRMSVRDDKYYIPDHTGYKDTNIYEEANFFQDTLLKNINKGFVNVEFGKTYIENDETKHLPGIQNFAGNLKCGSYNFYFKLSDADGNETETIAESSIVQLHIGEICDPFSIRMGIQNEVSNKAVRFFLRGIEKGFEYVHVFFARHSSSDSAAVTTEYFKIDFDYPVHFDTSDDGTCEIFITGKEIMLPSSHDEINANYADINNAQTVTDFNKMLVAGNISEPIRDYDELRKMSWRILPSYVVDKNVGNIDSFYRPSTTSDENQLCYYNTDNVYNNVGYWPDELYRFGIVYIFNDNSLSPVFNTCGVDFDAIKKSFVSYNDLIQNTSYLSPSFEPEDYWFDKTTRLNSRGVIKFPKTISSFDLDATGRMTPKTIGINFDLTHIGYECDLSVDDPRTDYKNLTFEEKLNVMDIKGFFFVRQKRIPTILAQGLAIGLTGKEFGSIPVIKEGSSFTTMSFLNENRLLTTEGTKHVIKNSNNCSVKALLVPDYEVTQELFNNLFNGNEYALYPSTYAYFNYDQSSDTAYAVRKETPELTNGIKTKLMSVPLNTSVRTDGTTYFSTIVGNEQEVSRTKDVENIWNQTVPQELTKSTSLIRGLWGTYVGATPSNEYDELIYGMTYNIKQAAYLDDYNHALDLDFIQRMNSNTKYFSISERLKDSTTACYRGDCFHSMYTHRMMWNFQDPETPNNHDIIDPSTWACNYGVKSTAWIIDNAKLNIQKLDQGWWVDPSVNGSSVKCINTQYFEDYLHFLRSLSLSEDDLQKEIEKVRKEALNILIECDPKTEVITINNNGKVTTIDYRKARAYENDIVTSGSAGGIDIMPLMSWLIANVTPEGLPTLYANKVCDAWEIRVGSSVEAIKNRKEVVPEELEQQQDNRSVLKQIFKNSANYEIHGVASINRSDVNAVGLGQWITFPILSSKNLAFRDVDFFHANEETIHAQKRGFFPLYPKNKLMNIPESYVCNMATGVSVPDRLFNGMPNVPFIKQEYITRIYNSLTQTDKTFQNAWKVINEYAFQDYTKIYGSITKLVPYNNNLIVVFKHGVGVVGLNTSAKNVNELLTGVQMISETVGSMWKDSVIVTESGVYGVDTVAKKIWTLGQGFGYLSDFRVQEFLNDNFNLSEFTTEPLIGHVNVKTHYNAFKKDVIFTFINDTEIVVDQPTGALQEETGNNYVYNTQYGARRSRAEVTKVKSYEKGKRWALCYNELTKTFTTRYDWYPLESANIDNIYFSFDLDAANDLHFALPTNTKLKDLSVYSKNVSDYPAQKIKEFTLTDDNNPLFKAYGYIQNGVITGNINQQIVFYSQLQKNQQAEIDVIIKCREYRTSNVANYTAKLIINGNDTDTYNFTVSELQDLKCTFSRGNSQNLAIRSISFGTVQYSTLDIFDNYELPDNQYVENKHHIDQAFQSNTEISFLNADFIFNKKVKSFTFGKQLPFRINAWPALKATDLYILSFYAKTNCSFPNQDAKWIDLTLEMDGNANIRQDKNSFKVFNKWHFYTVIFNFNKKNNPGSCDYRILTPTEWQYNNYTEPNCTPTLYFSEVKMTPIFEDNKLYDLYRLSTESITIAQYQSEDYVTSDNVTKTALRRLYDLRNNDNFLPLWKHGQAGAYDNQEPIKPTNWYGKQHDWFFEFVAKDNPGVQQIFNNLKIVSNNVAPHSFEYEVVGDSYDWKEYKPLIIWLNKKAKEDMLLSPQPKAFEDYLKNRYHEVLDKGYQQMRADYLAEDFPLLFREVIPAKLPFIAMELDEVTQYSLPSDTQADKHKAQNRVMEYKDNTTQPILVQDRIFNEQRLHTEQYGNDIKKFGRVRGNMQYLEDLWDVEIRPIRFKYVYIDKMNGNILKDFYSEESRLRDKYLKIKIKYTGEDLAIVYAVLTSLNYSYA